MYICAGLMITIEKCLDILVLLEIGDFGRTFVNFVIGFCPVSCCYHKLCVFDRCIAVHVRMKLVLQHVKA